MDLLKEIIGAISPLEWAGAVTGAIAVYLAVRTSIWTWAWGFVNVLIYGYVFYEYKLYSSMALFLLYFLPMQFYGYWSWRKAGGTEDALPVTRTGVVGLLPYLVGAAFFTAGWGYLMASSNAALPYVDAFQTGLSVVAQYLMARKKVESWWLWIVVDLICALYLYPAQKLFVTAGLFLIYLVLATMGLLEWQKLYRAQETLPDTKAVEDAVQSPPKIPEKENNIAGSQPD